MIDIFSTRELATGIWLLILIVFVFISPSIRKPAISVIKTTCSRQLLIPFIVIMIYALILTFLLMQLPIWENKYLKEIMLWVLFAGVPVCYGAINTKLESHYFKNILTGNLKFAVIVEFIISSFTFNFITEMIITPFISILIIIEVMAGSKSEYQQVHRFISYLLAVIGFVLLGSTLVIAVEMYSKLGLVDLLVKFSIPILFSITYIPVAYGFGVYAKYEMVFIRMNFKEPKDKKIRRKHRRKVFLACGLSYRRINLFESYISRMYVRMDENEFDKLIEEFKISANNK